MQKSDSEIVVTGTIPNKQELLKFNSALARSALFKHQTRTALVFNEGHAFHLTLYIKHGSEKILEHTFTKGPLHHWGNLFTTREEIS